MVKNNNDKKSVAVKKIITETGVTNNADTVNQAVNKSGVGKKEEGTKMKSKIK